jgi:serine/threonine-protein kinase
LAVATGTAEKDATVSQDRGTKLGPYEILAPLGAGGMGEVYRARDPRMGREVAIKVSAERFSDRFEREVRAVAALNHPNICHIYDVGPNYLVMELVEGPTLADRMQEGAIPLEEALRIARQIGDGLEAAHEKGIVHRDLKPANIKSKPDGAVKVLDFGLAKIAEAVTATGNAEESPTVAMSATIAGQIMGTAAYMAPEQARGKPVDKRADIWAFGVVLYEMLTGRRLFEGETISDVLAGVLTKEPEWERVPQKARRMLRRCLEKDPKRRLRDIGDAWELLEDAQPLPTGRASVTGGSARVAWGIAGVATVMAIVALWMLWGGTGRPTENATVRLDLDLGPDVSLGSVGPSVILSPDGTRLVYVSQGADGAQRLFTRKLDQPKAAQIPGTEGANAPFFSPDGQWVGFFAQGKLKKTRIDGGQPSSLCDAPSGRGATWGEDGNIVMALDPLGGLSQVQVDGGQPAALTTLKPQENTHRWPQILPGGRAVLFNASVSYGNYNESEIAVLTLKDHRRKTLIEHAGMYPRYLPSGHLVYISKGALFAVPFDLERLEVRGSATRLMEVSSNPNLAYGEIDFSRTGMLAYRTGGDEGLRTIRWLDADGKSAPLWDEPASYLFVRLSPDGSRVASLVSQGSNTDLWTYDWQRGGKTRLTNGLPDSAYPVWSRDGQFVVFHSVGGLLWTRADGAGKPQPLTRSTNMQLPTSFTPDGTRLVYSEQIPGASGEIRTVPVEYSGGAMRAGESQLFVKTATANGMAAFSPDGRWLAYADAEGGRYEVSVRAFPDNGTRVQVSTGGGTWPTWVQNGHELFYNTEDQRIMVVDYSLKGGLFVAGKPRVWFGKQLANIGLGGTYDLARDGKRLIVVMPPASAEPLSAQNHVMLALNFFDEVRRRVGQGK